MQIFDFESSLGSKVWPRSTCVCMLSSNSGGNHKHVLNYLLTIMFLTGVSLQRPSSCPTQD